MHVEAQPQAEAYISAPATAWDGPLRWVTKAAFLRRTNAELLTLALRARPYSTHALIWEWVSIAVNAILKPAGCFPLLLIDVFRLRVLAVSPAPAQLQDFLATYALTCREARFDANVARVLQ